MKIKKLLKIGKFCSSYGTKGYIKLIIYTYKKLSILKYKPLIVIRFNEFFYLKIEDFILKEKKNLVKFVNINSKELVSKLINLDLFIKFNVLKSTENIFYYKDLINFNVINFHNICIGYVIDILNISKSNDILVVSLNNKKKKFIPLIYKKTILNLNLKKKNIYINKYF